MKQPQSEYEVERVLQEENIDGKPHYLVKWKNFSATESTWEPIENLLGAIDLVHNWKVQRSSHTKQVTFTDERDTEKRTKKIGYEKGHHKKNKQLQKFLDEQKHSQNKRRRKNKCVDYEYICDSEEEVTETAGTQTSNSPLTQPKRSPSKRIQQLRAEKQSVSPKKSLDDYFSKFDTKQQTASNQDVNGFKVIGKITKDGIARVLWCFDWEGQKICEVELRDGKRANMKRKDLQRLCPDKLCQYLQKVVDFKQ